MLGKKAKSRLLILASLLILLSILVFIVLRSLEENVVYFLSPTDIYNKSNITFDKKIRDGGLVKVNSIRKNEKSVKYKNFVSGHRVRSLILACATKNSRAEKIKNRFCNDQSNPPTSTRKNIFFTKPSLQILSIYSKTARKLIFKRCNTL